jgi:hypothetical protein
MMYRDRQRAARLDYGAEARCNIAAAQQRMRPRVLLGRAKQVWLPFLAKAGGEIRWRPKAIG